MHKEASLVRNIVNFNDEIQILLEVINHSPGGRTDSNGRIDQPCRSELPINEPTIAT